MKEQPRHHHNCPNCIFLGRDPKSSYDDYDLYVCKNHGTSNSITLIARYGDAPHMYLTGTSTGIQGHKGVYSEQVLTAYSLAEAKKLL